MELNQEIRSFYLQVLSDRPIPTHATKWETSATASESFSAVNTPGTLTYAPNDLTTWPYDNWQWPTYTYSYSYPVTPDIKVIELKGGLFFYYWNGNLLLYALYKKGEPIIFKTTSDFIAVLNELGLLK